MSLIRFGVVGCGNMCNQHASSFDAMKDKVKVTAVCDRLAERAERAMEVLKAECFVTDYMEMIGKVDAVLIALPHRLHYPVGKFFLENGVHVLMEKPLCAKESECVELTYIAEEKSLTLMTAYPVRFWEETLKMKEYIDSGTVGEVFQMTIYTDHYNTPRDTRGTWMNCKGLGGGQTFSHGCHYVDIMLWFLGNPVSGTHMGTNIGTPWMDREGTSHSVIKFESGAVGYHAGTWGARGTTSRYKVEIYGTEGTLSFSTLGKYAGKIMLIRNLGHNPGEIHEDTVLWQQNESGKRTVGEIEHFIDCIITGEIPITNGYVSTTGLRVIWKMYEAEMKGEVADLKGLGLEQPFIKDCICSFDCDSEQAISDYNK